MIRKGETEGIFQKGKCIPQVYKHMCVCVCVCMCMWQESNTGNENSHVQVIGQQSVKKRGK
jgi:hypothetical protein